MCHIGVSVSVYMSIYLCFPAGFLYVCMCMCMLSRFSLCLTLCNRMDCSPSGSSAHGILQARILSGLPCLPPGDLPNPRIKPASLTSLALAGRFFTTSITIHPFLVFSHIGHYRALSRVSCAIQQVLISLSILYIVACISV